MEVTVYVPDDLDEQFAALDQRIDDVLVNRKPGWYIVAHERRIDQVMVVNPLNRFMQHEPFNTPREAIAWRNRWADSMPAAVLHVRKVEGKQ